MLCFSRALSAVTLVTFGLLACGCIFNDDSGADGYVASQRPPLENSAPSGDNPSYVLRPMDILSFEMYMHQDMKGLYTVTATGDLVGMPLIGSVHVGGLSLQAVREKITERYREFYKNPQVSLFIYKYAERKVYVNGFVMRAGPVVIPPEEKMTLSKAIAWAGGIQPRGKRSGVTITRPTPEGDLVFKIDVDKIEEGRAPDFDLQENDRIYVEDSKF